MLSAALAKISNIFREEYEEWPRSQKEPDESTQSKPSTQTNENETREEWKRDQTKQSGMDLTDSKTEIIPNQKKRKSNTESTNGKKKQSKAAPSSDGLDSPKNRKPNNPQWKPLPVSKWKIRKKTTAQMESERVNHEKSIQREKEKKESNAKLQNEYKMYTRQWMDEVQRILSTRSDTQWVSKRVLVQLIVEYSSLPYRTQISELDTDVFFQYREYEEVSKRSRIFNMFELSLCTHRKQWMEPIIEYFHNHYRFDEFVVKHGKVNLNVRYELKDAVLEFKRHKDTPNEINCVRLFSKKFVYIKMVYYPQLKSNPFLKQLPLFEKIEKLDETGLIERIFIQMVSTPESHPVHWETLLDESRSSPSWIQQDPSWPEILMLACIVCSYFPLRPNFIFQ